MKLAEIAKEFNVSSRTIARNKNCIQKVEDFPTNVPSRTWNSDGKNELCIAESTRQGGVLQTKKNCNSSLMLIIKDQVVKRVFKSVLLYGCEIWKITADEVSQLRAFTNKSQMRILRRFLSNVISTTELLKLTEQRIPLTWQDIYI